MEILLAEWLRSLLIIAAIQFTMIILLFLFGFKNTEEDADVDVKSVEFDWKREGF